MSKNTGQVERKLPTLNDFTSLIGAGVTSGLIGDVLSFPLGRIKTLMMAQLGEDAHPASTYGTVKRIYNLQGLPGFYRGFYPFLMGSIPGTTLFFGGVEATKLVLGKSPTSAAMSGLVGQITGSLVWVPAEILKELQQMTQAKPEFQNKPAIDLIRLIYQQQGVLGFYRGSFLQLLSYGPFNSLGFGISAAVQEELFQGTTPTIVQTAIINGISFSFSAGITTPCDVVKTQIQVAIATPGAVATDKTVLGCIAKIYRERGALGFFTGLGTRASGLGFRSAAAMTAYPKCKEYFEEHLVLPNSPRVK